MKICTHEEKLTDTISVILYDLLITEIKIYEEKLSIILSDWKAT